MKFFKQARKFGSVINGKTGAVVGLVMLSASNAHAALPAAIGTSVTELQTDGLAMADLIWPVVIALTGAVILLKLFKRFANKI